MSRRARLRVLGTWSRKSRVPVEVVCSTDSLIFNQCLLEEVLDSHVWIGYA